MKISNRAKIVFHIWSGFVGQITQVTHRSGMLCQYISVETVGHRTTANDNHFCFNIVLEHIPCGNLVEQNAFDDNENNGKHIEHAEQQPGKLRQSEDKQKCCYQRKADQVGDRNFNQFALCRANV